MPTTPIGENPVHSNNSDYDDLTVIKGIGQARQQWLRNTFHIRTYRDLAALSAGEIQAMLKVGGQIVSQGTIEAWIAQAKQHADSAGPFPQKIVENPTPPTRIDEWKPFASFVVEFQERQTEEGLAEQRTRVHHMEADKGKMWSGIERHELIDWILAQLGEKAQQTSDISDIEVQPQPGEKLPQVFAETQQTPVETETVQSASAQEPEPIFSEKLQQVLAKTQQLASRGVQPPPAQEAQPESGDRLQQVPAKTQQTTRAAGHAATTQAEPPMFSEQLQQVLAKTQQLGSRGGQPPPAQGAQSVSGDRLQQVLAKTQQTTGAAEHSFTAQAEPPMFSEKLQQLVAKAQQMISEGVPPSQKRK